MARLSFDEFADLLDEVIDRIPEDFYRDLNGGFNLREESKRDGRYYTMGEYVADGMLGCYIVFYYGSFVKLMSDKSQQEWEDEIVDTVLHEMQHHRELQAGRDDLGVKEREELARCLRQKSHRRKRG